MSELLRLKDLSLKDVQKVGGKAANMGELFHMGANAVDGFVVLPQCDLEVHSEQIIQWFHQLQVPTVAIRSSATIEDGTDFSFAGQFDTYLHITEGQLIQKIKDCRDSAQSDRVAAYLKAHNLKPNQVRVAVIVQVMVIPEVTGVAFTKNPISGDNNEVVIEACWGLGEVLVSGQITPDEYICDKQGNLKEKFVALQLEQSAYSDQTVKMMPFSKELQDKQKLTEAQLRSLVRELLIIEKNYGYPLDIEWIFAKQKFYIMQARPITT